MNKKAVLLINVGTPDSPEISDVKKYLSEFLNDKYVISIPGLIRRILVNGIIVPFRVKKSSNLYKRVWAKNGSPLLSYSENLTKKLQIKLGENIKVYLGMRYGNPSIAGAIKNIKTEGFDELLVFPLYPQYAWSTTKTAIEAVKKELGNISDSISVKYIDQFYDFPDFVRAFAGRIVKAGYKNYDHIIFSYHGLPNSHINKIHPIMNADSCDCTAKMPEYGRMCYKATCYETTRLIISELSLSSEMYSVGFQSRFSKNWTSPFTDDLIKDLAKKGKEKILVIAPSFVTDCLETIIEIEQDYNELFIRNGGKQLDLVHSLNDNDEWVKAIQNLIQSSF